MQFLVYGGSLVFGLICYGVAIWICVIGKKRNPNKGWNFIIASEIILIAHLIPFLYYDYAFFAKKSPIIFMLTISKYLYYISWLLILPVGMILFLVGLYYIAQGKKKKSKKAVKKRRTKRGV
jgi:hypothetical protein